MPPLSLQRVPNMLIILAFFPFDMQDVSTPLALVHFAHLWRNIYFICYNIITHESLFHHLGYNTMRVTIYERPSWLYLYVRINYLDDWYTFTLLVFPDLYYLFIIYLFIINIYAFDKLSNKLLPALINNLLPTILRKHNNFWICILVLDVFGILFIITSI